MPVRTLQEFLAQLRWDEDEVKFFLSNAPKETPIEQLLLVAFSRWRVERCFQDQKQEIGLDAWEGRRYVGLKRHLILSSVSYLFLARTRWKRRKKKPALTVCQIHDAVAALLQCQWLGRRSASALLEHVAYQITYRQERNVAARKSHIKRTRRKLRALGIKLTETKRCSWDSS